MAEYTPTEAQVRECFVDGAEGDFIGEDFDRWLAEVRREAAAEALRVAAEDPHLVGLRNGTRAWLHQRADRIKNGGTL